jgi:hypothetical protein
MPPGDFSIGRLPVRRTEDQLLLCCATLHAGHERPARIAALTRGAIDWPYLLEQGRRHGLLPLLYANLRELTPQPVPPDTMAALREEFRANTVRNLVLGTQLLKIIKLFHDQGIPVIPYKGPTLSIIAYGDIAFRHFADLDFIVHKRHVMKCKDLLLAEGYQPMFPLSPGQEKACLSYECEYNFHHPGAGSVIELHWDVVRSYCSCRLDVDALWKHLQPMSFLGRSVPTLASEQLLLVLCIHGGKHQWERLGWVSDVAQLLNTHADMDWKTLFGEAVRAGAERMLLLGLYLARRMLGAKLPPRVDVKLSREPQLESLAIDVCARLFDENGGERREIDRLAFFLKMRENPRDKIRYLVRRLFTPTPSDWSAASLPAAFYRLYHLHRPFRLAKDVLRNLNSGYW